MFELEMKIRPFVISDYPEVCEWWRAHEWPPVPLEILSDWGMLVEDAEKPYAAVWLYLSNSKSFTAMEWMVTNPLVGPRKSFQAIEMLVERVKDIAMQNNYTVFTWASSRGLIRLYEQVGFKIGDRGTTTMVLKT